MSRELLPGELSWADSYIIDLLSEEEKYQDELKALTSSAVMGAIASVAEISEEIAQGFLETYHKALDSTSRPLVVVDENVDAIIIPV
ncbi:unnamed protein product, partial [marine sediment metagenome]